MESAWRSISEQQMNELRVLCHMADLKVEAVKGIIQGFKVQPKACKTCLVRGPTLFQITILCFISQSSSQRCYQHEQRNIKTTLSSPGCNQQLLFLICWLNVLYTLCVQVCQQTVVKSSNTRHTDCYSQYAELLL